MGYAARNKIGPRRVPLIDRPGVIAVVSGDRTTYPQFAACVAIQTVTPGSSLVWRTAGGGGIARARNECVREAIDRGAGWIWFIDDDHTFAKDTLARLLKRDRDIVVPTVLMRSAPHKWIACEHFAIDADAPDDALAAMLCGWRNPQLSPGQHGAIEIGAAGTGGMLIASEVLHTLTAPWFEFGRVGSSDQPSEDTWFCLKARRAGFPIFCDLDTSIGHLTTCAVWPSLNRATGDMSHKLDFDFDTVDLNAPDRAA